MKEKPAGGRILVVEDEAPLRRALVGLLEREGFEVETASDGIEALESLRQGLPDLILLDVRMPHLGGLGFLEGMRRAGWSVPVVVLTANEDVETAKSCLRLGACSLVSKPVSFEFLQREVYGFLPA